MLQKHELGLKVVYLKDEKTYVVCTATLRVDKNGVEEIVYNITNTALTANGPVVTHYDIAEDKICTVDEFKSIVGERLTNL